MLVSRPSSLSNANLLPNFNVMFFLPWVVAWPSGNAFHPINEVASRRVGLVL